jgi:pimeloyl-ACP methyl ester carboxylesterase
MRILVAGHPETAAVWQPLASRLSEPTTRWSLPGYGTPLPDGMLPTKEGYRDWLIDAVAAVGEPVHLVGHGLGRGPHPSRGLAAPGSAAVPGL